MTPIAYIESPFVDKFGIPKQAGMTSVESRIVFYEQYRYAEAVRGLEEFDYIWLLWRFDTDGVWHPTVRPPRLGGNTRMGVFATRSPFRPNPLGLSSVRLKRVSFEDGGPVLYVEGADMRDRTEIYDIKPYIPYADSHPEARSGFAPQPEDRHLQVEIAEDCHLPENVKQELVEILSLDPRPRYQDDSDRLYTMSFAGYDVTFVVIGSLLTVKSGGAIWDERG